MVKRAIERRKGKRNDMELEKEGEDERLLLDRDQYVTSYHIAIIHTT